MARLNDQLDSEDELPELSSILGLLLTDACIKTQPKTPRQEEYSDVLSHDEKEGQNLAIQTLPRTTWEHSPRILTEVVYSNEPRSGKQRLLRNLKQANGNHLLLPISDASDEQPKNDDQSREAVDGVSTRASPRRLDKGLAERLSKVSVNTDDLTHYDDDSYTDLSGFIVPDSATDGELQMSKLPKKKKKKKKKKRKPEQKRKYRSPQTSTANSFVPEFEFQEFRQPTSERVEAHPSLDDRLSQ